MTTIVGIEHEGNVWIGGDSAVTAGKQIIINCSNSKVFRVRDIIFGHAGTARMATILRHCLAANLPSQEGLPDDYYASVEIPKAVHGTVAEQGYEPNDPDDGARTWFCRSELLIGLHGKLYAMACDYNVKRSAWGYDAVGTGGEVAIGYLFGNQHAEAHPQDRIHGALLAGEKFTHGTRGPFTILCGNNPELDVNPWAQ